MSKNMHLNNVSVMASDKITEKDSTYEADFEKAITATGFGKFNLLLMLISIPAGWASIFETTTMSYVFPVAQCDLNLSLHNKGLLNAITYIGMVSSAFIWGFLCDTLGRKKLMVIGFFLDGCFVLMSSLSQSFALLLLSKFLGGFIINGPFAALTSYLSEFHCAKHRARVQMVLGIIFSSGNICMPLLAWAVLSLDINITLLNGSLRIHPWNIYLFICALPSLISGIIFIFLPESPKFLMTIGENEKALEIFQTVYKCNTNKPRETFPVKRLINETKVKENEINVHGGHVTANRTQVQALMEGWQQIKPLFFPPFLQKIILVCLLQMMFMLSLNTLRLWLPQIFQAIHDYQLYNNGSTSSLCTMLDVIRPAGSYEIEKCIVNTNNSEVFINNMIVAAATVIGYMLAGTLINTLGKKKLLFILGCSSSVCGATIYFAQNIATTLALSSVYIALSSICVNVMLTVVVDLFPTTLRTMTISLTMMMGRFGAMSGNLIFPLLLQTGCAPPFFSVAAVIISSAFLSLLLPNTDMKALE